MKNVLAVSVLLAAIATTPAFAQTSNGSSSENSAEPSNSATSPYPTDAGTTRNQDAPNRATSAYPTDEAASPSASSDKSDSPPDTAPASRQSKTDPD